MSLEQRSYSVLVASASQRFVDALSSMLPESVFVPVHTAPAISAAKRALLERAYDFVIVNSPLPDDPGVRFAIDACTAKGTVVLLFAGAETHDDIYERVSPYGVFTLPKPISRQAISQAFRWMVSTRERLRSLAQKTLSTQEKMEEIRLVNRAKWLLISELKMDEPQAHRYIEKQAMDQCVTKRKVAEDIIRTYS